MADTQLFRARREFVDRVSKDVVVQLLDDLLEDGVINDGEKEAVIEENGSRAERARHLIDKVQKKGPKASGKLISRLSERDPNLCELLKLAPPESPAPAAKLPQQETTAVSPVLISCTAEFKRALLEKEAGSIYVPKPKGQRRRLALLINNVQFDHPPLLRRGAERDKENMEKLLNGLDYTVDEHSNLSAQDIDETVKKFSQREEHLESDSAFVVIMSHGKRDVICGVRYNPNEPEKDLFSIDNIFKHLNNQNCPALRDKPKVIVIQACRGDESGSMWACDSVPNPSGLEDDGIRKLPKERDFICLMSCTPDTKSYRSPETGTLFIQKLVETINTHAHKDHIVELFRKASIYTSQSSALPSLALTPD
ncbi:caspase a-like [Anguilla rostrata]|uniref:caspase a-like n=1 Tax=Anguilla rostrata TaxID=7938 RepID=UPI0030CBE51B